MSENATSQQPQKGRSMEQASDPTRRILYCHCAFSRVVKPEVKEPVLRGLSEAGVAFDAVPDLCELAARQDPSLKRLAADGEVEILACYPRAVRWLFHAAEAPLPEEGVSIHNMRAETPEDILSRLFGTEQAAPEAAATGAATGAATEAATESATEAEVAV